MKEKKATKKEIAWANKLASITVFRERTDYEIQVEKQAIRSTWSRAKRFVVERKEGKEIRANQIEDLDYLREKADELSPEDRGRLSSKPSKTIKIRIDPMDAVLYCSHLVEEVATVADKDYDEDGNGWTPSTTITELAQRWQERHGDLGDAKEIIWDSSFQEEAA